MHTNEKYELLLSAISHEIRNPVTLINSYLQLISSAHPEVGTFEYWNTVGEEMQHLKTLLGDLSLFNNSMKIASDLPSMELDPDKLQQVLDNLLRNAAEAHASHITLEATTDGSLLYLTVSDNGCGIPREQLPHLFEPFVSYKSEGSGLGLAIVQRIIKAHHGTITVQSEPSSDTRFIICLPFSSPA